MAKQKYERTKPHVNVGTMGHIDHGKTTLTQRSRSTAGFSGKQYTGRMIRSIMHQKRRPWNHDQHSARRVRDRKEALRPRGHAGSS